MSEGTANDFVLLFKDYDIDMEQLGDSVVRVYDIVMDIEEITQQTIHAIDMSYDMIEEDRQRHFEIFAQNPSHLLSLIFLAKHHDNVVEKIAEIGDEAAKLVRVGKTKTTIIPEYEDAYVDVEVYGNYASISFMFRWNKEGLSDIVSCEFRDGDYSIITFNKDEIRELYDMWVSCEVW